MNDERKPRREEPAKEPYEKPSLAAIDLTADQVLGFGCKTAAGFGFTTLCIPCGGEGS